jgi:hypothetical protein
MFSFSEMRKHLSYANVMATLALVFAMSGGALAASHYLINSTKQINPKILKALRGKNGSNGPAGPAGPQGAKGETGSAGAAGKNGEAGSAGSNGKNGESVQMLALLVNPSAPFCKEGGAEFKVGASSTHACTGEEGKEGKPGTPGESVINTSLPKDNVNCKEGGTEFKVGAGAASYACTGEEGKEGKEGSPWTAGGTLPSGKTETGTWSAVIDVPKGGHSDVVAAPISFPIPLSKGLKRAEYIKEEETAPEHCKEEGGTEKLGTAKEPEAEKGYLCVFEGEEEREWKNATFRVFHTPDGFPFIPGQAAPTGLLAIFKTTETETEAIAEPAYLSASGSWAVTEE